MTNKEELVKYLPMISKELSPYCVWCKQAKGYDIYDDGSNPAGRAFKSSVSAWKYLRDQYAPLLEKLYVELKIANPQNN